MVVCGTARVTIGDEVQMLRENELVSVPSGAPHRLEIPARSISSRPAAIQDNSERIEDDYTGGDKWDAVPSAW